MFPLPDYLGDWVGGGGFLRVRVWDLFKTRVVVFRVHSSLIRLGSSFRSVLYRIPVLIKFRLNYSQTRKGYKSES